MMLQIVDMRYLKDYKIWIKFNDGLEGIIDLENELWGEMFEPLKDKNLFKKVKLNKELGTIVWENGADFAPEFLYKLLEVSLSEKER